MKGGQQEAQVDADARYDGHEPKDRDLAKRVSRVERLESLMSYVTSDDWKRKQAGESQALNLFPACNKHCSAKKPVGCYAMSACLSSAPFLARFLGNVQDAKPATDKLASLSQRMESLSAAVASEAWREQYSHMTANWASKQVTYREEKALLHNRGGLKTRHAKGALKQADVQP